ncbi:MAG TPA: hypothetical protein VGJ05_15640 [Fimbriiglobus sp.]
MTRSAGSPVGDDPPPLRSEPIRPTPMTTEIRPVAYDPPPPTRAATLAPRTEAATVSASQLDAPSGPTKTAADPLDDFIRRDHGKDTYKTRESHSFGDGFMNALGSGKTWLCSDRDFEFFASPVTNPFLFEDPRSLTEIRPILMYQKIPSDNPQFQGGSAWFLGTQARLAFTDRLSLTMNKLGLQSFTPGSASPLTSEYGLTELQLAPKYTFYRDPENHTIFAAGMVFQIPIGSSSVYQDTGNLSLVPYLSYAQSLACTRAGTVNVMANTGYSIATSSDRSDFWYISGHLDLDLGDQHRFYPLMEMNYFLYTKDGQARPGFGAEGRDLANIGANAEGSNLLTWAIGGRFKISESAQIGAAFELPVLGNRDLFNYRFTMDFILRF